MIGYFTNLCPLLGLIARKVAELFGFNCGFQLFYTACCFNELSRGSVWCLSNASFKTAVSQLPQLNFYAKIDDHGIHRSDTGQILAQWRHLVASRVALDLPHWVMRSALYRLIHMAVEMTSEGGVLFCHRQLFVMHITVAKRPCYGQLKIKQSRTIVCYYVLI